MLEVQKALVHSLQTVLQDSDLRTPVFANMPEGPTDEYIFIEELTARPGIVIYPPSQEYRTTLKIVSHQSSNQHILKTLQALENMVYEPPPNMASIRQNCGEKSLKQEYSGRKYWCAKIELAFLLAIND
jgi:hypothetical protein